MKKMMAMILIMISGVSFSLIGCGQKSDSQPQIEVAKSSRSVEVQQMGLGAVMSELIKSMEPWSYLTPEQKKIAVGMIIGLYAQRKEGIIVQQPEHYANRIDEMLAQDPNYNQGLHVLVRFLAIMDYDFDNGQDKDELARQTLGEQLYAVNKMRFQQQQS